MINNISSVAINGNTSSSSSLKNLQQDLRDAFTLFDKDNDGYVGRDELGSILRSIGYTPSETDITSYASQLDPNQVSHVTMEQLSDFVSKLPAPPSAVELEAMLHDAFRVFDKDGSGTIPTAELRHIMTSLGERLNETEADEMVKEADPEGKGIVDYAAFIKRLVSA